SISPSSDTKFLSHINDINPQLHESVYRLLQSALTSFIPLFEHTLTDLHQHDPLLRRVPGTCRYKILDEPQHPDNLDGEDYERKVRQWIFYRSMGLLDVPNTGYPGKLEQRRHSVYLISKRIYYDFVDLGPSRFAGTPWHVEGMKNEGIVACGFPFTAENIESCDVQSRMAISYPRVFDSDDTEATLRTWGVVIGDQYISSVPIREGLAVVFPNIYQHKLAPITVRDPSKVGKFTVLSFLLVDLDALPVISTANVAPQQRAWMWKALDGCLAVEIVEKILDMVDGLMDEQESQGH
ncbi:hypothetical protein GG344DRAFT_39035, partial [Lentinula edodes]